MIASRIVFLPGWFLLGNDDHLRLRHRAAETELTILSCNCTNKPRTFLRGLPGEGFCRDCGDLKRSRCFLFCFGFFFQERNSTPCRIFFTKTNKIDFNMIRQHAKEGRRDLCFCNTVEPSRVQADIGGLKGDRGDSLHVELIKRNVTRPPIQFKGLVKRWFSWKSYFNIQYLLSKFT